MKHALVITKGFKDLLLIGNQSRPRIFDLNIKRPSPLYSDVIEVDERVTLVGYTSDPESAENAVQFDHDGKITKPYTGEASAQGKEEASNAEIVQGLSGEAVHILKKPDLSELEIALRKLYEQDYRSIAVIFAHSYTYPDHEIAAGKVAEKIGFTQISLSSQLLPMIKMLPRGVSSTADAYLTPILRQYLDGFFSGFDKELKGAGKGTQEGRHARVEFMGSDGGLLDLDNFSGLKSILSGPAGGVVGYALTSWDESTKKPIIG
jgi:5-oxoprolinase (ATP-hydrolysing)